MKSLLKVARKSVYDRRQRKENKKQHRLIKAKAKKKDSSA